MTLTTHSLMAERCYGPPDFIGLEPLAATSYSAGVKCTYDGRPAIVCVPPVDRPGDIDPKVLIRYTDGARERVLVSAWECAAGVDSW
jgi:hypothetical protein